MNEKELAIRLVRDGVATQGAQVEGFTEANADPAIRACGNAAVANALEFLGKHGIVADVQPTLGQSGMGFAYRIHAQLVGELSNDEILSRRIAELFEGPASETSSALADLLRNCEKATLNLVYRDDLLATVKELRLCFSQECYIACLALSGKLLEICLKQIMIDNKIQFDDSWMIGTLLRRLREADCQRYLDQTLSDIANVINKSRIPAVHAIEKVPVPSREQAVMVIHAVIHTMNRAIVSP